MDFFQKLYDDLIEQFKGKPKIEVYQWALARQLDELCAFFYALRVMRWLQTAEGKQLDGIGDIVVLSRMDALILAQMAGQNVPMEDELYRKYLAFKIFLNTSSGTYMDVHNSLKMFWPQTPIYYSERLENPATMFWTLENINPFETDTRVLSIATMVKAAGVALRFVFTQDIEGANKYHFGAMTEHHMMYLTDDNEIPTEATDFHAGVIFTKFMEVHTDE